MENFSNTVSREGFLASRELLGRWRRWRRRCRLQVFVFEIFFDRLERQALGAAQQGETAPPASRGRPPILPFVAAASGGGTKQGIITAFDATQRTIGAQICGWTRMRSEMHRISLLPTCCRRRCLLGWRSAVLQGQMPPRSSHSLQLVLRPGVFSDVARAMRPQQPRWRRSRSGRCSCATESQARVSRHTLDPVTRDVVSMLSWTTSRALSKLFVTCWSTISPPFPFPSAPAAAKFNFGILAWAICGGAVAEAACHCALIAAGVAMGAGVTGSGLSAAMDVELSSLWLLSWSDSHHLGGCLLPEASLW